MRAFEFEIGVAVMVEPVRKPVSGSMASLATGNKDFLGL
jgi:hypothetical protein